MEKLNRFEKFAAKLTKEFGVHVEWAPANREYVVEGRPISDARGARKLAKKIYREVNALMGGK